MKNSVKKFLSGDGKFMSSHLRQFSMAAVSVAIMQVVSAQVTMTNVVPMQVAGQGTEIRVMFNGLPPQPQAYQVENPSRLILDFNQAKQSLSQTAISVATTEASSIDVASDEQRARLTVNLNEKSTFNLFDVIVNYDSKCTENSYFGERFILRKPRNFGWTVEP